MLKVPAESKNDFDGNLMVMGRPAKINPVPPADLCNFHASSFIGMQLAFQKNIEFFF